MKTKVFRPFLWLSSLLILASLACNISGAATTEPPPATQEPVVAAPTVEPTVAVPTEIPTVESGAVKDLDGVKSAVIQIIAEGSFQDPGEWNINVGSSGTGFIIDPSGIAVTNNHVVTGAAFFKVYVGGDLDKAYDAKVLGVSECPGQTSYLYSCQQAAAHDGHCFRAGDSPFCEPVLRPHAAGHAFGLDGHARHGIHLVSRIW